ncbi:exodeoxyribonuclease V subunit gamma [Desulfoplanes formicivorans]|uniref:Exodeoxyribonuclease V subunit gamma n=1 Tax=Desulfoplanes formicivorans TaxID=1592317 RepID=A0A194AHF7_9BACT|nr:exodeoxyribonuclease V subunit gamma [Desulfoplanes formicivorans]GAU08194.1 exodeoxyribonuclease V subunit gamma [Desulfoplanes formicivorans]
MQTGCRTFLGNRLEDLVDQLAHALARPLDDPFEPECVMVQSQGMARYLSLELARRLKICANMRFSFPVVFFYDLFRLLLPDTPEDYPFAKENMVWELMDILPGFVKGPEGRALAGYLRDGRGIKIYQLAEKIAYHFDQYLIFRPDMVVAWEQGKTMFPGNEHEGWQSCLWQQLVARLGATNHRASLTRRFLDRLAATRTLPQGFPRRLAVFGISSLPPMYLDILSGLGRHIPVSLYLLSPCQEYWADVVSLKEKARLAVKQGENVDLSHLETGNDLLASLGRLGRDFQDLLLTHGLLEQDMQVFVEPGNDTLLHEIQGDILGMTNPPQTGRGEFVPDDSVRIASCHSPMREIEVLHDHLLDRLEKRPELVPEDIVVMCPDIGTYAPYVQAVFGAHKGKSTFIPFHIADQSREQEHPAVKGFFQVLDLVTSRFEASAVLSLLDSVFFREKAGLAPDEVDIVRDWVRGVGINWGIDADFKQQLGLPGYGEHTWVNGLERMLLGVMMPRKMWSSATQERDQHADGNRGGAIVPFDLIEGGQAGILGRFVEFVRILFAHVTNLEHPRSARGWRTDLVDLIRDLMQAGETLAEGLLDLVTGIEDVFARAEASGFDGELDFPTVRCLLRDAFGDVASGGRFLSGGVSFCTLQPMRSIPFKIVCLVGLSDGAFPRQDRSVGFDLIRTAMRKGDRSLRMDDRYLFLEALISARDEIYFSYLGQDARDNTPLPPSVLLSEVMDYLDRYYPLDQGTLSQRLTVIHRLQGFHPSYFDPDSPCTSYVRDNLEGAVKLLQPRTSSPFIQGPLALKEEPVRELPLDVFLEFWNNPARFLVQRRLGIILHAGQDGLQDVEPLERLDFLVGYLLGEDLMHADPKGWEEAFARARGANKLPPGTLGRRQFDVLQEEVGAMRMRVEAITSGDGGLEPLTGTIACHHHDIAALLGDVFPRGQVLQRFAKAKGRDFLRAWIHHLVLQVLAPSKGVRTTWMVAKDGTWRFDPVDDALSRLEELVDLFDQGHNTCLPFFPESSHVFAVESKKDLSRGRAKARTAWLGSGYGGNKGERENPYFSLCFRDVDALDQRFEELAEQVFGPLVQAMTRQG